MSNICNCADESIRKKILDREFEAGKFLLLREKRLKEAAKLENLAKNDDERAEKISAEVASARKALTESPDYPDGKTVDADLARLGDMYEVYIRAKGFPKEIMRERLLASIQLFRQLYPIPRGHPRKCRIWTHCRDQTPNMDFTYADYIWRDSNGVELTKWGQLHICPAPHGPGYGIYDVNVVIMPRSAVMPCPYEFWVMYLCEDNKEKLTQSQLRSEETLASDSDGEHRDKRVCISAPIIDHEGECPRAAS